MTTITLSKTLDPPNTINKTYTNDLEITINLPSQTDLYQVELTLGEIAGVDFRDYNSCQMLDRQYFIVDIKSIAHGVWQLTCVCDVLETHKTAILASPARWKKVLESGDYGHVDLDLTGRTTSVTEYESDVTLVESNNVVLTTSRWP